jgi:acyl carrier protein
MSNQIETVDIQLIHDQVCDFIRTNFLYSEGDILNDGESLFERGIVDETGILELVMFVEETYGVQVSEADLVPENFDTVNNVVAFVSERLGADE